MTISAVEVTDLKKRSNALIGEEIHRLMWREGLTQKQLGQLLGVDQGSVSKRLRGKTDWTAIELLVTAEWLGVSPADLLPNIEMRPDGGDDDGGAAGAPTRARTWDLRIK
ncbi:helix-turn-helix transcriptional regulator, partial [Mycobacterium sp. CBMA311]|uniref:helix-turn-helix domain-containing protein n=1 Tax=Mycolicibacterium sp. CBMA 311 TaxID=2606613 RepID=UPI0012DD44BE